MSTGTEEFWAGEFGDDYSQRQNDMVDSNVEFFLKILYKEYYPGSRDWEEKYKINSVVEFGAGSGMNIKALQQIMPSCNFTAVEINESAANQIPCIVYKGSIFDFTKTDPMADLVLVKGLSIHIPPEKICIYYDILYKSSKKYILMAEYYSPKREEITYRGHEGKLWKANFYEEITNRYPELKLLDYGFVGPWDEYPQDSLTWWLLEKPSD